MARVIRSSIRAAALKAGWRSGLEHLLAKQLKAACVKFKYEKFRIPYVPEQRTAHYTPDFLLENGIVVESKGRFVTADRKKHLAVQAQHPTLDIRFVFSNSRARIGKKSKTTYAVWAENHGFQYADVSVPKAWLTEPTNATSLKAARKLLASHGVNSK